MIDETLTVPCEGIGVWEGARVRAQTLRYGEVSCTVVRRTNGMVAGWWDVILDGLHVASAHTDDMCIDLTHRPTRLEVMARLADRLLGRAVYHARFQRVVADGVCGYGLGFESDSGNGSLGAWQPDLGPTDDTCLPDGARVVDVRALAIVCRHVFSTKLE